MRKFFYTFLIISVLANLYMYGRCCKTSGMNHRLFDELDYKWERIKELEKENVKLKAEIVILQRADTDNRRCELDGIAMLPSWELRP